MGNIRFQYLEYVFAFLFMLLFPSNVANGQVVSQRANGKTYVFDKNRNLIYNQFNENTSSNDCVTEGFYIKNYSMVADVFKSTLTSDRIKDHKKDMVAVMFDCNVDGRVRSAKFLFTTSPFLTVEEVEKLERAFLNRTFEVSTNLEAGTTISFTIPCFFSRIQKEK